MWEAFLLQMNDFDRYLDSALKHMLDFVVASPPPLRRGRIKGTDAAVVLPLRVDMMAAEAVAVVEPVVTIPVAPARTF